MCAIVWRLIEGGDQSPRPFTLAASSGVVLDHMCGLPDEPATRRNLGD